MCLINSVLAFAGPVTRNRAGVRYRLSDRLQEGVILRGVPAADRVGLVVDVSGRMIRVQHEPLHVGRAEMEYARFVVIDPDDRVKMVVVHEWVLSPPVLSRVVGAIPRGHVVGRAAHHVSLIRGQEHHRRYNRLGLNPGNAERCFGDQLLFGFGFQGCG